MGQGIFLMASSHDSFDGSPHGAFRESPHEWRGLSSPDIYVGSTTSVRRRSGSGALLSTIPVWSTVQWIASAGQDGFVVSATRSGGASVKRYNTSGGVDWSFDTGVNGGQVKRLGDYFYVVATNKVYAIDALDGTQAGVYTAPGNISRIWVNSDSVMVCGNITIPGDGFLVVLSADLSVQWQTTQSFASFTRIDGCCSGNGNVYVGGSHGATGWTLYTANSGGFDELFSGSPIVIQTNAFIPWAISGSNIIVSYADQGESARGARVLSIDDSGTISWSALGGIADIGDDILAVSSSLYRYAFNGTQLLNASSAGGTDADFV
jgi:hypothetical protein